MFEEGQLYSPVTTADDGTVTVHLGDDHPGVNDPDYRARRNEIAAVSMSWSPGQPVPRIDYTETEHEVWRTVCEHIAPLHEKYACRAYRDAVRALDLPRDRVPQLDEVTTGLQALTGFSYVPAAGIVPLEEFYGSLEDGVFHSTQYLRHHAVPLYTPEPDLIHEVIGHGNLLADPQMAELNRLAGAAARRCETKAGSRWSPTSSGSPSSSVSSTRAGSCARTAPASSRRTARSRSSAGCRSGRSTSPRWRRSTTTSRTTSRCCSRRSRSTT